MRSLTQPASRFRSANRARAKPSGGFAARDGLDGAAFRPGEERHPRGRGIVNAQCPIAGFRRSGRDHETGRQSGTWTNTDVRAFYESRHERGAFPPRDPARDGFPCPRAIR